jgi:hypothetical protein
MKFKIGQWFPAFSYLRTITHKNGNFRTTSEVLKENIAQACIKLKIHEALEI